MSRGDGGVGYSFNIPGVTRRTGVSRGLAVLSLRGGCHGGMVGLAAISGIGGLHVVIGLPITSLRGGCGGTVWLAVLSTRGGRVGAMGLAVLYLRGGGVGVMRLVVFSLRGVGVGVMGLAVFSLRGGCVGVMRFVVFSLRGGGVDVIGLAVLYLRVVVASAVVRACGVVIYARRSRRWWGRACDVVPTRRWCRCDAARGVVPARRSCWWSWACDNIVMRCRRAVRVQHSRVTRRWRLGRSWDLRVSRQ